MKHLKKYEDLEFIDEDNLEFIDEDNIEPSPDDFIISSNGWKYSVGSEDHGFLGEFEEMDDVIENIEEWMKNNNWVPNIWIESDHGNLSGPYSIDELTEE